MTVDENGQMDQISTNPLYNVLESIVNQTLDHIENHPNLYSTYDLNTLHAFSNKFSERVQTIHRNLSRLVTENSNRSASPCKAIEEECNSRIKASKSNVDVHHFGEARQEEEDEKQIRNSEVAKQHERNFPDVVGL